MLLFGGALFSCSSSDGDDGSVTAIELSVDKAKILADGQDAAVFKVMDNLGTDLTNQCVFTVNNEVYSGNTFTSMEEGTFRVRAQWQDFESNLVSITVVDESNVQLSFTSDKQEIWADGGDGARLSVTDHLDRDLTAEVVFYVNGEVYESSFFTSKTEGQYLISAEYDGKKVGNVLRINAKNELRSASTKLGNYYSIITERETFTDNLINVLEEGADKLTLADMNEESANMLSLQTQQQLAINSLSLASQASQAVLRLF